MLRAGIRRRSVPSKTSPQMLTCVVPRRRAGDQPSGSIFSESRRIQRHADADFKPPVQSRITSKWPNQSSIPCQYQDELIDNRADGRRRLSNSAPCCLCKTIRHSAGRRPRISARSLSYCPQTKAPQGIEVPPGVRALLETPKRPPPYSFMSELGENPRPWPFHDAESPLPS
jgi:hypothetical protein